jgi:hypothetical protein
VIRLGLRLTLAGGREAVTRLTLITVAVAIGVGLLLTTLASLNAVNAQNSRYAWLETGYAGSNAPASATPAARAATNDPLWWLVRADYYHGTLIGRVDLAATGPDSPLPPGIARLPGPEQFYASPALATLLHSTPSAQLGDRFPGTQIGTIGSAALPAPNSLIIIIGRHAADLSHQDGAVTVTSISTTVPSSCNGDCVGVGTNGNGITLILSVVAAALLFPVLIFIGGATRLSAARREQRFAAMRLVGATPGQIAVISTVESAVAAIAGVCAGFGLFYALRPALATIPFTGDPFFTGDLSLSVADVLIVALGIPIAAAVAARFALRRVNISPLGVTRRVTPPAPRGWRVIPLLAGIIELGYFAYFKDIGSTSHTNSSVQAAVYVAGVLLIMAGLVIAGPWLTMRGSHLMARRATRLATLIAGRRLADNPQAGFRAISGLVLALFVGTCAIGIITTVLAYHGGTADSTVISTGTLIDQFSVPQARDTNISIPNPPIDTLTAIPGVTGVAVTHTDPDVNQEENHGHPPTLVSCTQLAYTPVLGHCPPGAHAVTITPDFSGAVIGTSSMSDTTWPAADVSTSQLQRLPVDTIVVGTNGSTTALEQARTVLEITYAAASNVPPLTISEFNANTFKVINSYRQLANIVILASLPIAGCSLAVNIAGGLSERKRPFSLLRLSGAPLGMLRRVITLEAAAPLLITAIASIGAGLLTAQLFLRAQLAETLQPPGVQYYIIVAAGLLASLGIIASTLPLLNRITGPEVARNE